MNNQKTAIVTGGAGPGIGHGITEALLAAGWAVVITDRKESRGRAFVDKHAAEGRQIELVVTDVTDDGAPELVVQQTLKRFGRVDGLVNNAGVGLTKLAGEVSDEEFWTLFNVDFMASFRFVRAALPELIKSKGGIVNIGSVHAHGAVRKYSLYAATKAALAAFTRGLAADYGDKGVRANTVHPGLVDSPQNETLIANFTPDPKKWIEDFSEQKQCLPRLATAREVGELVAFLLGSQSITGQSIFIDGGTSALLWDNEVL
ncbi:MAG: SDR family oxidoreductase [Chthoniobacterales bacterium]